MKIWQEVSVWTGRPIDEDAPANSVAGGGVSMPPDAVSWKNQKKKRLYDGRTKSYKEHRKKLEAKRATRLAKIESKRKIDGFIEGVKKKIREYGGGFDVAKPVADITTDLPPKKKKKNAKN
ncbi:uncharacterized protein METZ01_LOCUS97128 [marine metagenome]|uniref:Uncharacterized protein n=1 Tax=marine metagenome TaxID=408172 RepID=A0A381VVH0_9ZZZZ